MSNSRITITSATEADIPHILAFIRGLAEYEKLSHRCVASAEGLRKTLFGPRPYAEVLIARLDGLPVGFALFFHSYSTFLAQPGIYLEDIFVVPEHRGAGAGRALLRRVAQIAHQRGCGRLEWSVLDWNQPAIEFYQRVGATVMPDWRICRMSGDEITRLAEG
jgi:GNAT superfamily N-acetyltransferase